MNSAHSQKDHKTQSSHQRDDDNFIFLVFILNGCHSNSRLLRMTVCESFIFEYFNLCYYLFFMCMTNASSVMIVILMCIPCL